MPDKQDDATETIQLLHNAESPLPRAVALSASEAISKSITDLRQIDGFGFSLAPASEQARVLRTLADQIEAQNVVMQAMTFEEMTAASDFTFFRYTIRFAERQTKEKT